MTKLLCTLQTTKLIFLLLLLLCIIQERKKERKEERKSSEINGEKRGSEKRIKKTSYLSSKSCLPMIGGRRRKNISSKNLPYSQPLILAPSTQFQKSQTFIPFAFYFCQQHQRVSISRSDFSSSCLSFGWQFFRPIAPKPGAYFGRPLRSQPSHDGVSGVPKRPAGWLAGKISRKRADWLV